MTSTQTSTGELQAAIYPVLSGDATLTTLGITGVFDFGGVPNGQPFPYITIGEATEGPFNAFQKRGYLSRIRLHIWDNSPGFKRAQSILARMNTLIDQQQLTLATQHFVYLLFQQAHLMNDPGLDNLRHVVCEYETFTQEI